MAEDQKDAWMNGCSNDVKSKIMGIQRKLERKKKKIASLEEELKKANENCALLQNRSDILGGKRDSLKERVKFTSELQSQVEKYKSKVTDLRNELKCMKDKLKSAKGESDFEELQLERDNLKEELSSVRKELAKRKGDPKEDLGKKKGLEDELMRTNEELNLLRGKAARSRLTGWKKCHENHQGKRVPSRNANEMADRLTKQSNVNDCREIRKGEFVRFLPGARCYGYFAEAGTNITLVETTKVPVMIRDAAFEKATKEIKELELKGAKLTAESRMVKTFVEMVTSMQYSFVGDHQGPTYVNGHQVDSKPHWATDDSVTVDFITKQQSVLLRQFIDLSMEKCGMKGIAEKTKKEALLKALNLMVQNHRKQGLATFGGNKGRTPRKLTVPPEMWPGNVLVEKNSQLDLLPPKADGRKLPWPLIGEPSTFPNRAKKLIKGKEDIVGKKSDTEDSSDGSLLLKKRKKGEEGKKKIMESRKKKRGGGSTSESKPTGNSEGTTGEDSAAVTPAQPQGQKKPKLNKKDFALPEALSDPTTSATTDVKNLMGKYDKKDLLLALKDSLK